MSQTRTFGGCYTKSTVALTWTEARDVCSSNGGYLFKPTDLFEGNLFMYEYDCVFIGLFWNSTNGWKWLDGKFGWNESTLGYNLVVTYSVNQPFFSQRDVNRCVRIYVVNADIAAAKTILIKTPDMTPESTCRVSLLLILSPER